MQSSGAWSSNRQTARDFDKGIVAYHWADNHHLIGVEVLMAFEPPEYDVALFKI